MRVNQYQARLGRCVEWHSIYYRGGLGGEALVILEYAHAGGREAAAALPAQKKGRSPSPPDARHQGASRRNVRFVLPTCL